MTSLVSLAAVISVVTAAKQPRGGTWVNFCWVYMGRWPLTAPNPLWSIIEVLKGGRGGGGGDRIPFPSAIL